MTWVLMRRGRDIEIECCCDRDRDGSDVATSQELMSTTRCKEGFSPEF